MTLIKRIGEMSKIYSCFQGLVTDNVVDTLNKQGLKTIYVEASNYVSDFFPRNYIDYVGMLYLNKLYDVILIDASDLVIDGLICVNIPTKIICPERSAVFEQYHMLLDELEGYYEHVGNSELLSADDTLLLHNTTLAELVYSDFTFTMVDTDVD